MCARTHVPNEAAGPRSIELGEYVLAKLVLQQKIIQVEFAHVVDSGRTLAIFQRQKRPLENELIALPDQIVWHTQSEIAAVDQSTK